ncbi:MAG: hypothetical protein IKE89_01210 [Bacilli bacterium]|jgi:uncharacterized membrane protein YukC|nr:hypothetical protein [Bacilli bacterium]
MESWEDLIKTLPTDETLEQKEKSGELKDIDRKIEDIQAKIENMKTEMDEREEINKMLNSTPQEQTTTKKTK